MSLAHYIKLSLYNKGKQDSKLLFESRAKVISLKKEKGYLSKTLENIGLYENKDIENSFLFQPTVYERTTILPQPLLDSQYLQGLNIYLNQAEYALSNGSKWLNSKALEKVCDNFNLQDFLYSEITPYCKTFDNKATEIREKIRKLKIEVKQSPCSKVFLKIKQLVLELHSLVTVSFNLYKIKLKNLEKSLISISLIDLRGLFRNRVSSILKCFSDFSDSEEDSETLINLSPNIFFNLINRKRCIIKMKLQIQLIYI
jgi:hypothetical protein